MSSPPVALATPYRWLSEAIALLRAHPRVMLAAAVMMVFAVMVVTLAQMMLERVLPPSIWLRAASQMLLSVALMAPIIGGFYRLVHGLSEGRAVRAGDIFSVFSDAPAAARLIAVQLVFFVLTVLVLILPAFALGGAELHQFVLAVSALQPGATKLPPLPGGLLPLLAVLVPVALLLTTAKELATVQVALSSRLALPAAGEAVRTTARNAAAFLLFYLPLAAIMLVVMLILALVFGLLGMLLALINPALSTLAILPLVAAGVLLFYPLMFGFFYRAWREGQAPEAPPSTDPAPRGHFEA